MHAVLTHLRLAAVDNSLLRWRDFGLCLERGSVELLTLFVTAAVAVGVAAWWWSSSVASAIDYVLG